MTGKPQFEHKNPRFSQDCRAWRALCADAAPCTMPPSSLDVRDSGNDVLSVGLMALPDARRGQRSVVASGFGRWDFRNETAAALLRLPVRGRDDRVPGRRRRRRRPALAFLQGPAGLFAAAGLRAAGDDPRARRRRLAGRRIRHPAPALHSDPGRAEDGDQRLPRRRGQELLRAQRPRLRRHHPRRHALCADLWIGPPAAGRLHHHPAGRQELPADQRGLAPAQDQGGAALAQDRAHLFQGEDPRALSQRNLSRPRRLRRGRRVAALFRQVGARADRSPEAAYLAALPKAPNNYNPFRQRDRALERRNWVHRPDGDHRRDQDGRRREGEEGAAQRHDAPDRRAHLRRRIFRRRGAPLDL